AGRATIARNATLKSWASPVMIPLFRRGSPITTAAGRARRRLRAASIQSRPSISSSTAARASLSGIPVAVSSAYRRSRWKANSSEISDSIGPSNPASANRFCTTLRQSGMFDPGDPAHRSHESLPPGALRRQDLPARRRELVIPRAPGARAFDPRALNPPTRFQPVQQRVERRHLEAQRPLRTRFDQLGNLVSMPRAFLHQREDQEFRAALLQFSVGHGNVGLRYVVIEY